MTDQPMSVADTIETLKADNAHMRELLKETKAALLGYPQACRNYTPAELLAAIRAALK